MTATSGYGVRARYYAAEIARVPQPDRLAGLLRPGSRVAEVPSATGHFLGAYAASEAEVVLIDSCLGMLKAARRQARRHRSSVPDVICCPIQDLTSAAGPADLAVIPNAALNQLAADNRPAELLAAVVRILAPGALLLAQVVVLGQDGSTGACGFYDPAIADGEWAADREFADEAGRVLVRRRRQQRHGNRLDIEFEFSHHGRPLYTHIVALRLLTIGELRAALAEAQLTEADIGPGAGGLNEVLAIRPAGSPR